MNLLFKWESMFPNTSLLYLSGTSHYCPILIRSRLHLGAVLSCSIQILVMRFCFFFTKKYLIMLYNLKKEMLCSILNIGEESNSSVTLLQMSRWICVVLFCFLLLPFSQQCFIWKKLVSLLYVSLQWNKLSNNLYQAHFLDLLLFIKVSCYFNTQFSVLSISQFLHILIMKQR